MSDHFLKNANCYLAGSVGYSEDLFDWRNSIVGALNLVGVKCLEPNKYNLTQKEASDLFEREKNEHDWRVISDYMKAFVKLNLAMIDLSTFVIGSITPQLQCSTIHQIAFATSLNKPVLLFVESKEIFPLWLSGVIDMSLVFESWHDMIDYLMKVDVGEINVDTNVWRFPTNE